LLPGSAIGGTLTLESLGNVGELIGGFAVAVSLVYLAIQLRQSARTTRAEMLQQHSLSLQNALIALGSDSQASRVWNVGLRNWDDLSEEEQGQFSAMLSGMFTGFESSFNQYRSGLMEKASWGSYQKRLRWYVARKGVRAWWKLGGHMWVSEAYGVIINELVSEFEKTDP
jgi:hypothetical protein